MTTSAKPRPGAVAKAERRLLVQLSVAAISMATLAISWLGIAGAEQKSLSEPVQVSADATANGSSMTTLVPAPATSQTGVVRRSRAS